MRNSNFLVRFLLLSLSVILLISSFCSCSSPSQKLFFWKISSGTTHVYLLGEVSNNEEDVFPLSRTVEDAFNFANNLVIHVYDKNVDQQASKQYITDHAMYPDGDGFKKHVDDSFYQQLYDFAANFDLNISGYDQYKPWIIYNVLSQQVLKYYGYTSDLNIDSYFVAKAEKMNKKIMDLEAWQYRYDLYASVPDETITKMMQYDVTCNETAQDLKDMLTAWKNGDLAKMENLVFKPRVANPDVEQYYKITYEDCAFHILMEIETMLNGSENYFIVVRARLLVGEKGLLNLLSSAGFTVEQLDAS